MAERSSAALLALELRKTSEELLTSKTTGASISTLITKLLNIIDLLIQLNQLEIEQAKLEVLSEVEKNLPDIVRETVREDLDRRFDEALIRISKQSNLPQSSNSC